MGTMLRVFSVIAFLLGIAIIFYPNGHGAQEVREMVGCCWFMAIVSGVLGW